MIRTISMLVLLAVAPAIAQEGGISGDLERAASTSDAEKIEYAESAAVELQSAVEEVATLLEEARRTSTDVERLECITRQLQGLRVLLGSVEDGAGQLAGELQSSSAQADHTFRRVVVARGKGRELLALAQQCTDDGTVTDGSTQVDWTSELLEGSEDLDGFELDPLDLGFDPPAASPYQ
ncbi:MAG: hypothetical protein EP330_03375 [Deltaproteobacteria bacterium]|nr:MAG: hypothetical protein EP330_03375 [Deltaproteobacteria bacterium]